MKKRRIKKNWLIFFIIINSIIIVLGIIYLLGLIYFSSHFLPKTTLNSIEVSGMNSTKVNEILQDVSPSFNIIELKKDGGTVSEEFDMRKLNKDISYDSSAVIENQDKLLWFISMFKDKNIYCNKITGTFNKDDVETLAKDLICLNPNNIVMPKDASLNIRNGQITLDKEINGTYINEQTLINLINTKLNDFLAGEGTDTLDLSPYYDKPSIKEDDPSFKNLMDDGLLALNKKFTINITSQDSVTLDKNVLTDLLKYENNKLVCDDDKLSSFIHDLYFEHINDNYGYISRSQLMNDLISSLPATSDRSIDLLWKDSPNTGRIEVTINSQTMDYYEDEVLVLSSPIVSGNPAITEETIHGKYIVQRMSQDSYLMGRDYLEHVDYWIGFDSTGRVFGLHDASWRNEFGGDIWTYDPSRGCVNMPLNKIAILYDYVGIGTEVYVHD